MYDSEVLEYWGKTCRFYKRSKLGYFAFENGQRTRSSFMLNSPFPSCCEPHYKSEATCKVFVMKISFHSYANN